VVPGCIDFSAAGYSITSRLTFIAQACRHGHRTYGLKSWMGRLVLITVPKESDP